MSKEGGRREDDLVGSPKNGEELGRLEEGDGGKAWVEREYRVGESGD